MVTYTPFKALHGAKIEDDGNAEINVERYSGANIRIQSQASAGRIETTNSHELWLGANATGRIEIQSGGLVSIPGALTVSGTFNATLATAAQTNITSLGSLSSLDVNGDATVSGNLSLDGSNKELRFYEGSNYVGFEAPALSANKIWVLPASDGSANQALTTDGSGNFQWSSASSIAGAGSNLSLANGTNNRIVTAVDGSNLNGEANLTFDGSTLTVAGNMLVNNNGSIKANGSGSLLLGNTNSGIIKVHGDTGSSIVEGYGNHLILQTVRDSDDIIFRVNAGGTDSDSTVVEAMRIHGPDANIGIGTTSPGTSLHLSDAANVTLSVDSSHATGSQISLDATGTGGDEWRIVSGANNAGIGGGAFGLYNIDVSAYRFNVKSTGEVGIGIDSPVARLQVLQNNAAWTILAGADVSNPTLTDNTRKFMRFGMPHYDTDEQSFSLITGDSNDGVNQLYLGGGTGVGNAASNIFFNTAANSTTTTGTTRMTIKDSGNVGIGTTSPARPFHVVGDAYVQNGDILLSRGNFYLQDASDATKRGSFASDGVWAWENVNVGIGTTSPETKLHVDNGTLQLGLQADDFYTQLSNNALMFHRAAASFIDQQTDNGDIRFRMNAANDDLMILDGSAMRVGIGTTSPQHTLDIDGNLFLGKSGESTALTGSPQIFVQGDTAVATFTADNTSSGDQIAGIRVFGDSYRSIGMVIGDYNSSNGSVTEDWIFGRQYASGNKAGIFAAPENGGDEYITANSYSQKSVTIAGDNDDIDFIIHGSNGEYFRAEASTGRVGLGTTSPSSELEVAGNTTGNVQITIDNDNTAGLGTFTLQEDGSTTGIFQYRGSTNGTLPNTVRVGSNVAGGSLAFTYAGGTTGMYIKGGDGNVGIGTTSPSNKLHVESADEKLALFKSTDAGAGIQIDSPNDGYSVVFFSEGGTDKWSLGKLASNSDKFSIYDEVNNTPRLVIASSGYVGIGTTSPSHKLHLSDSSRVDIKFSKDSSEDHYIRKDGDYLRFRGHDDSTILMEMRNNSSSNTVSFPSGNVGIGTNTPSSLLHIHGDMADGKQGILITRNDTSTADTNLLGVIGFDSSDGNIPSKATEASAGIAAYAAEDHGTGDKGGDLVFFTSPIDQNDDTDALERMRIDSQGKIGIGTNDPCDLVHIAGYGRVFTDTAGYLDGNIFNSYSWSPMSDLTSPPAGFTINGGTDENSIVYGQTPLGSDDFYYARGLLWRFQDSGNSSASGGFLTATPYPKIDINKSYRMSVWIKRSHLTEGSYYMGIYGMNGATGSNVGLQDVSRRGTCDGAITTTGTFNATFTSGSAVLTNISINTNLLTTGMSLFDAADGTFDGIPDNTTIQSIDSSSQITMSANATASHSLRPVNYGKTSILLDSGHSLIDAAGTSTRYAVINNVDRISYTDIDNNVLTGIPLTGEYAISQAHADNAKIMQLETNAYFVSGDLPEVDKWYLVVGYVQGQGDTDYTDRGAVYDGETGNRVAGAGNFQWWSQSTYVRNRVYMFYSDDNPEQIQHAFDPRFEEISGAPQISTLLGGKITTGMSIKNDTSDITPTSGYVSLGEHSGTLEINTASGYLRLGAANSSYNHIQGENEKFYFNKPLVIDGGNTSGSAYQISSYASEDLVLATQDGAENRLTIKSDTGNVGIGTTAPSTPLHVRTTTTSLDNVLLLENNGGSGSPGVGIKMFSNVGTANYLEILHDAFGNTNFKTVNGSSTYSQQLYLQNDGKVSFGTGNVGIGTTSPNAKLHVSGDTYIQSATANQLLRVHADTDSSPSPRIEMMRGAHDTWGTGDNYTDWRIENSNDLIFYSGFSSQSSGAAVERLRIHSDSDGLSINGTLVGLGQFVIFGEEGDLYSGTGSTGNANGYQFSYGDRRVNVTNASNGTDFGINVPHNCVLERVDVVFGNSGNVSSGTTTFVVVKNGSNQSGNLSTNHTSGVHDSHHTGLSHTFSAGDRFNLRTTTSSRQVGPMRMTATFKRTA